MSLLDLSTAQKAIPVLVCKDVKQSIEFYQNLGFKHLYGDEHYAAMGIGDVEFHLSPMNSLSSEQQQLVGGWTSFRIQSLSLETLYDMYVQKGLVNSTEVRLDKKPYGMMEFTLLDPSGVAVTFYEDLH